MGLIAGTEARPVRSRPEGRGTGVTITQAGEARSANLESVRALAALAVMAAHLYAYAHGWAPVIYSSYLHRAVMAGGFGVQLFFTLSGYLLYRAFARRDFAGGAVDLRRYARNRALRILPLYYCTVVLLLAFTQHGGTTGQWWRFLVFSEEFSTRTAQTVDGPMWSLVVEVTFYLLLPVLAWALARLSGGRVERAIGILLVAGAADAVAMHEVHVHPAVIWNYSFVPSFIGFVPGMVLALLEIRWAQGVPSVVPGWARRSDAWVACGIALWLVVPISYSLADLLAPADFLLLGACVLPTEQKRAVRLLDWRPLAAVGVVSYSLYLWHVPVITQLYRHLPQGTLWLVACAAPASIGVAAVSYLVVERPFLSFRSRWAASSPQITSGRPGPGRWSRPARLLRRSATARTAAGVGLIALAVRLAAIAATSPLRLGSDPRDYNRIARSLAAGHGFGPGLSPSGGPSAFRAPLYPVFLGGVYRIASDSVVAARVVEALLGVVTVGLIALAAWLLWGPATAWAAGVIAAVFPPFVVWSTSLLSESIYLPLEVAAVVAALLARRSSSRRLAWAAGSGLAAGLGVLARPNGAALVPALAVLALAAWPGGRPWTGRPWAGGLAPAGVVVVVACLTVLPWLARDYRDFHRFVPISTIDGYNLAGEYNAQAASSPYPTAYQWRPPVAVASLLPLFSDRGLNEATLGDRLRSAGEHYIGRHPQAVPLAYFWNSYRMAQLGGTGEATSDMQEAGFGRTAGLAGMAGFWVLAALAAVGILGRRLRGVPRALWAGPLLLWLVSAAFLGTSRIRAPIDPFLVLAAAAGAVATLRAVRNVLH